MKRMVALIGPGKGPMVPLHGKDCSVRLTGLESGEVEARVDEGESLMMAANGLFILRGGTFVQVSYAGSDRSLIAEILRED